MKVHSGFRDWNLSTGTVASLGNYDGVHIGHQAILKQVSEKARELRLTSVVITFDPIPKKILYPDSAPPLIQTLKQRLNSIAALGIEHSIVVPFDLDFSRKTPEDFVREYLTGMLNIHHFVVGRNFSFGHQKKGNIELLRRIGSESGFEVDAISEIHMDGIRVSSTAIREMIQSGKIAESNRFLGRPFALVGIVVEGEKLGGKLGIPTANLKPENEILPARGVYVTSARIGGASHPSVTNVGIRPTVGGQKLTVESHLLKYSGNLYGAEMELEFLSKLRDEMRFPNVEELKSRIHSEIGRASCRERV